MRMWSRTRESLVITQSTWREITRYPASNLDKVTKIVSALELKILPRDLRSKDTRHTLSLIFSQWLSLSTCTFQTVVEIIPPPSVAQRTRIPKMLWPDLQEATVLPKTKLERDLFACNPALDSCVTVYVSKMFAVPRSRLPQRDVKPAVNANATQESDTGASATPTGDSEDPSPQPKQSGTTVIDVSVVEPSASTSAENDEGDPEEEVLIGFARLYSGVVSIGQTLYCLLPKYDTSLDPHHPRNRAYVRAVKITALYEMMGRDLLAVESVVAGNVFAVGGLEGKVYRNATLCGPGGAEAVAVDDESLGQFRECLVNLAGVNNQVRYCLALLVGQ